MNYKTAFLGAVAAACVPSAFAEETDRQDAIEVTSIRPLSLNEVTSSYSQINSEELEIRDSVYIADQLRAAPGIGISRSGAQASLTQIRIRGSEGNHTLVLLDGIEVSNPISGETNLGLWSGLNLNRIEIARGEQSSIFGSGAIGGVVSLSTDRHADSGEAHIEAGSFGSYRGIGNISFASDIGSLGFSASHSQTDGVDTSGLSGEKDGSKDNALTAYGALSTSEKWELTGLASYRNSNIDFDSDTDFDGLLNDVDRSSETDQYIAGLALTAKTNSITHLIRASFNQVTINSEADNTFTNQTEGKRTKLAYLPSFSTGSEQTLVTLTGILDWDTTDYERVDTNTFFGDPNQSQTFETLGLGAEALVKFNKFILNTSIRQDDNQGEFEDATTWRVGTAYSFASDSKLRASIGSGVKNPTFTELFGFTPASFIGNPDLKAEQSTSWEIGYDQSFGPVSASITYYEAELEDEIFTQFNPDFTSSPANRAGDSERSGIELDAKWTISDSFSVFGAFSDISSTDNNDANEIRVPEHTGSIAIHWNSQRFEGLKAGAALDYVGKQQDRNFGNFQTVQLDAYSLVSANIEIPVAERLSVTLRGENILDETTTDIFGYNATGAGVFLGLKIR